MWMVANQVVVLQKATKVWKKHTTNNVYRHRSNQKRSSWLRVQALGINEDDEVKVKDENIEEEKAAILIQSHFRGYMVRKKWGPILEERIKEIVSTTVNKDIAKEALQAEGLDEEEAAQVLQRYYRKWKVSKQNSVEGGSIPGTPKKSEPTVDWDAPFRFIEAKRREKRRGKKKPDSSVNLMAHRIAMIQQGLASQKFQNELKDAKVVRDWNEIISTATDSKCKDPIVPERKLSKLGKHLLVEALEQKIHQLRHYSGTSISKQHVSETLRNISSPLKMEKRHIKIGERNVNIKSFEVESIGGETTDFRKMLRKTGKYPTENQ